jgi:DNA-binding transcriptional regulator YdaS (Cro superfamily)
MKRDELNIIGGATEVARLCGIKPSAVSMWFAPKDKKGLGGKIPYKHAKKIAAKAATLGKTWSVDYVMGEEECLSN